MHAKKEPAGVLKENPANGLFQIQIIVIVCNLVVTMEDSYGDEKTIYDEDEKDRMLDDDEIDLKESGFMLGYMEETQEEEEI